MLKTDYNIPIFEDTDAADLNKYSNEMANALKTQINNTNNEIKEIDKKVVDAVDKFTEPLSYKGQLSTIQDLPISATNGDIYNVTSENKNYIYNGTNWVEYSSTLDLTYLENNTKEVSKELKEVTENKRLKVEGKSEQATRSGKNKLKITNFTDKTTDGVTFTAKFSNNKELEYIEAKGNSTTGYNAILVINISDLPAGDYIINGLGTNKVIRYVLLKNNDTNPKIITNDGDTRFTQDSSSPYIRFRIDLYMAGEINTKIKPMIRQASITDNTYEPYGVSPSPDYPSRIRTIGDNINEFSSELELGEISNDTGINSINTNSIRTKDYIKVKPNTTYTIKNSNNYMNVIYFYKKDKTYINYSYSTETSYTFTTGPTAEYIRVCSSSTKKENDLTTKYKLEKGSIATPYTPYDCGSIDYAIEDTSNNIFNKDTDIELDGQYRTYKSGNIATNQYYYGIKVKVEENREYKVFSYQDYSNLCYFDKDMNYLSGELFGKNAKATIFKTPSNCEYITLAVAKSGINEFSITEAKTIHFPLSKGQVIHKDDYIMNNKIHQNRKTYTITGNENWVLTTGTTNFLGIYLNDVIKDCVTNEYSINVQSNIATGVEYNNRWKNVNTVSCRANTLTLTLDNVTTLQEAKAYLKSQYANGTPVIVEYKLAEEIVTPLAKEQIEALYELQKAKYVDKMELTCLNEIKPTLTDIDKSLEESLLDVEKLLAMLSLNS